MDKFSLYDLLGLLLPGALLIFFLNLFAESAGFDIDQYGSSDWLIKQALMFCLAIISGSGLYSANFYLITCTWYNRIFGMYKDITGLLMGNNAVYDSIRETLNIRARTWYDKDIFLSDQNYSSLAASDQRETNSLQDEFYNKMYYELEYHSKLESPKTMQSFYFFFRQTVLAGLVLIILLAILYVLNLYQIGGISFNAGEVYSLTLLLFILTISSVLLARWYRKRMVIKMFWMFYTHINQK